MINTPGILVLALLAQILTLPGITLEQEQMLLKKSIAWSVPQPDPEARLHRVFAYTSGKTQFYLLGFINPSRPTEFLLGLQSKTLHAGDKVHLIQNIDKLSLQNITSTTSFEAPVAYNYGFITGIQLLRAGYRKKGLALIDRSLAEDSGHGLSPFRSPANEPPQKMLARACLAHAYNSITSAEPDFRKIQSAIQKILRDQPDLKSKSTDWLLESLRLSVAHPPSPEGSIEALIDGFLMCQRVEGLLAPHSLKKRSRAEEALILQGFKAIPALLKQRHSKRFSNHLMEGFNNFVSHPMTADQAINAYLQRFANSEFNSNWLERQQGMTSSDQAVQTWWEKASAMGEEAYLKKYLVTTVTKNGEKTRKESKELLLIAADRYPDLLILHYEKALNTTMQTHGLIRAIVGHKKISRNRKIALLQKGLLTKHEVHRNVALEQMFELHPELATKHLVRFLKIAPASTETRYWFDQNAALARFVSKSTHAGVWAAFHDYLTRADLGMKMELISNLRPPRDAPPQVLASFYQVYQRFNNDYSVRLTNSSGKFQGPCAGFSYDRLTLRDFIHLHWKSWLGLKLNNPKKGATSKTWLKFRRKVATQVKAAQ